MVQISELKPFQKKVDMVFKVMEVAEAREVQSKLDETTHKVTEAVVADATGCVLLTLWDDTISKAEAGKSYKLGNGFTSLFKNTLRLNIGRYGTLEETEDIGQVNTENNVSTKEFERGPRRFGGDRGGFGGRGGGYGGGRGGGYGGGRGGGGFGGRGPRRPREEEAAPTTEQEAEESFEGQSDFGEGE